MPHARGAPCALAVPVMINVRPQRAEPFAAYSSHTSSQMMHTPASDVLCCWDSPLSKCMYCLMKYITSSHLVPVQLLSAIQSCTRRKQADPGNIKCGVGLASHVCSMGRLVMYSLKEEQSIPRPKPSPETQELSVPMHDGALFP